MKAIGIVNQIDRWGSVLLIYLIPWQARLIFHQGFLAGVPSEPQTRSLFAVELMIAALVAVRLAAMLAEKRVARNRLYAIKSLDRILLAFGCLAALSFFSVIVSADQATTFAAALRLVEGLAVFFLVATAPSEREARLAFLASALVQAAIAVLQAFSQHAYPSVWLGMAAHYPEMAGTSVVESAGLRFLRAYGTLPHPNILGGMIVVAILGSRPLWRRVSFLSVGTYLLLGVGLFFSFSRLAWLALAAGIAVQWVWARRDLVFVKHAAAVVGVMLLCAGLMAPLVFSRVAASGRLEEKSLTSRLSSFDDAWRLIKAEPVTGVGDGEFAAAVLSRVDARRGGYDLQPVHSALVAVWAEIGFFGFLLFIWLMSLLSLRAWRSGKLGLAAALVVFALFDHWAWTTYAGILIFWAGWGLTLRSTNDEGVIQKAGAIIVSRDDPGKILLLYRDGPNYCDWTIPKGHMEPGESREDTTRREIREETGLEIDIIEPLPDRDYLTGHGHTAVAHFFLARSRDDSKLRLESGYPKDKLEWVPIADAERVLSFDNMKKYYRGIKSRIARAAKGKTP